MPVRILALSPIIPFPPVGGGALRTFHLLRHLAACSDLTLVGFTWGAEPGTPPFPARVIAVPWENPRLYEEMSDPESSVSQRAFEQLATGAHPWFVSYYTSLAMEETIRRVAGEGDFDLVLVEHTMMGQYLPALPERAARVIDLHNIHARIAAREAELKPEAEREGASQEATRTLRFEREVCRCMDVCIVVSEKEAEAARELLGVETTVVIPNGVDTSRFTPAASAEEMRSGHLLFTGMMNYDPNIEAVEIFCESILPLILEQAPEARFHVVGANPPEKIRRLASDRVFVHGEVPETGPFFREAEAVVVPLRHGGGTRLKILEAAASGKAIVSTTLGAEGLDFRPGRDLILADSPVEFAAGVVEILRQPERRQTLERNARAAALAYDWDTVCASLQALVRQLTAQR